MIGKNIQMVTMKGYLSCEFQYVIIDETVPDSNRLFRELNLVSDTYGFR